MYNPPRSAEEALLRSASRLWELEDLGEFRPTVLAELRELIGCDVASYNEIVDATKQAFVVADPHETLAVGEVEDQLARFGELVQQNPLAAHSTRTGETRTLRMSDFISPRALHALELYDLIYRYLGVEYQLAFTVPAEGQLVGVTLSRATNDFDDREVALMEGARAIIMPVYRSLYDRARLQALLRALEVGEEVAGAVILVHSSGLLAPAHPRAEQLLADLERDRIALETLRAWVATQRARRMRPPGSLRLALGARALEARYVHGPPQALDTIAVRESAPEGPQAFRALGLTRRQSEVLHLLSRGAGNAEIALALNISEHTVRHHLEQIYRRLGVGSRAAAAHAATRLALGRSPL
ncbi:MAG TPA: LuxR C-terminal-related transcriptional regulator [Solirubrobacteraceae bacterium]|jgi:DNA-binding CsgD family transcriptional regulator|nr:LuxR C-terminal-related transcriptional regulator [Solirubrobacteraceae bacterium]